MRKIKLQSLDKLNNITKVGSQTVAVNTSVLSVLPDLSIESTQCIVAWMFIFAFIEGHNVLKTPQGGLQSFMVAILCRYVVFVTSHIK